MPYNSEKIPIAGTDLDLRKRLSDTQRRAVKTLAEQGYSQRQIAEMFRCSKGSVQNILHPFKRKKQSKRPKEYWTEKKRQYRQRKQQLFLDGKLKQKRNKQKHKQNENLERNN